MGLAISVPVVISDRFLLAEVGRSDHLGPKMKYNFGTKITFSDRNVMSFQNYYLPKNTS